MSTLPPGITVAPVGPDSPAGRAVLTAYYHDIVSRYHGRAATAAEVEAAMTAEPSGDLHPPSGLLLLARRGGTAVGCAGLLPGGLGEVTRMFVAPPARGQGLGTFLLHAIEHAARDHRVTRLRLDTHRDLVEARQMYARNGYRETAAFSEGPYVDCWFEKFL
jgi:GNAT superfamily N-acetyltransferase